MSATQTTRTPLLSQILGPGLHNKTYFPSRGKVSRRSAKGARRFRIKQERNETSAVKHKTSRY